MAANAALFGVRMLTDFGQLFERKIAIWVNRKMRLKSQKSVLKSPILIRCSKL